MYNAKTSELIERAASIIEDSCDVGPMAAHRVAEEIISLFSQVGDEHPRTSLGSATAPAQDE